MCNYNKINKHCNILTVIPPKQSCVILKADTGASKSYVKPNDKHILQQRQCIKNGPQVNLPDGSIMDTIETRILPLNNLLSTMAKTGNVLKGLTNASFLSIGQLCNDNCIAVFSKYRLCIYKNGCLILKGVRNWTNGLWDVVVPQTCQSINVIVRRDRTKHELAEYLHKCAFSPALSTFQKAIRMGHFISWPGIMDINFKNFITNIFPTAKGHLDQERSNLRSTKMNTNKKTDDDFFPKNDATKKYKNAAMLYPITPKLTTYSNQMGRFPQRS